MNTSRQRGVRPALCILALLLALAPCLSGSVASAQGALPPDSGAEIDDAMLPDENGSDQKGDGRDDNGDGQAGGDDEEPGGGSENDTASTEEEPGGLAGYAVDSAGAIFSAFWGWTVVWLGNKLASGLGDLLLFLPDPSGESDLRGVYENVQEAVAPLLLIGFIVMGILVMVRSANAGLHSAGLKMLPKIVGVAIVLGALPFLFGLLSTVGTDLTRALLPEAGRIDQAQAEMTKAIVSNLAITNFLNLILALVGVAALAMVMAVALLKGVAYDLLFVVSSFALIGSLIPGFSRLAATWCKAVLVCAALPAMWAAELWLGSVLLISPESVFGGVVNSLGFITNGAFTTIIAIAMFYFMYKTPFVALSWAISSYNPSFGGGLFSFGKFAAGAVLSAGIKGAVGGLMAGAGMKKGLESDRPSAESGPADKLGGIARESIRRTERRHTDEQGRERTSVTLERTQDVSRQRTVEHDELMAHFAPYSSSEGPEGSPPPPKTQGGKLGGPGGSLPRGDDFYSDKHPREDQRDIRDNQKSRREG